MYNISALFNLYHGEKKCFHLYGRYALMVWEPFEDDFAGRGLAPAKELLERILINV